MPSMDNRDDREKIYDMILAALAEHERQIDQLITRITAKKEELTQNKNNLNKSLDEILKQITNIEKQIQQVRTIRQT
jgi:prefoldin subunit 5